VQCRQRRAATGGCRSAPHQNSGRPHRLPSPPIRSRRHPITSGDRRRHRASGRHPCTSGCRPFASGRRRWPLLQLRPMSACMEVGRRNLTLVLPCPAWSPSSLTGGFGAMATGASDASVIQNSSQRGKNVYDK
jgi:hypothetical protein